MSEPNRLRILFDGTTLSETPYNWTEIVSVIKRVRETNSIWITTEAQLTFHDDGYTYLLSKYNEGFCSSVAVELQEYCSGFYETFFIGIIFLKTAEIDRKQCTITVLIEDNSFYAKINNNRNIEVFPFGEQSKNGDALVACDYEKVQMFDPNDGTYIGVLVNPPFTGACYPVHNLFQYLISFMSDSTIGYDSTLFGAGGDYEGLTVTIGIVLRQYFSGTTATDFKNHFPKISFQQLFTEVNKKVNIGMYIDYSTFTPTLRIERRSFIQDSNVSFTALNIDELKESLNVDELYSTVRIGSSTVSSKIYSFPETGLLYPEEITFVGCKEEQFTVLGDCNIDSELNLVSEYIISSNVIEDCLIHGENSYDDQIIFINCDVAGGNFSATQDNIENQAGVFPVYYNQELFGRAVMDNYFGAIPLSIAQYLGSTDDTFLASEPARNPPTGYYQPLGAFTDITMQILFSDDTTSPNHNVNGNYSTVTSQYTCPVTGLYTFTMSTIIELFQRHAGGFLDANIQANFVRYDSFGIGVNPPLSTTRFYTNNVSRTIPSLTLTISGTSSIVMNATDTLVVSIFIQTPGLNAKWFYDPNATFACINTQTGGGTYQYFDPNEYPIIKHEWNYPLTKDNFKTISQNQIQQLEFSRSGEKHYNGWIDSVKFKRFKEEMAEIVTYTSKNNLN